MGRPQLVIVVECDPEDTDKIPRDLFDMVRMKVELACPSADVSWHEDESEDDTEDEDGDEEPAYFKTPEDQQRWRDAHPEAL